MRNPVLVGRIDSVGSIDSYTPAGGFFTTEKPCPNRHTVIQTTARGEEERGVWSRVCFLELLRETGCSELRLASKIFALP